ncbi:hypothetical protein ACLQ3C_06260 [Gordonia sp. DT30]|uniref:hypothetical protein n=1 Tax=Gordonia sp. DT30 TaxID=3416546 RepID=UPI003CF07686
MVDAAVVLRTAADQLGKLRDEILATVDDMMVRTVCDVADSGVATVRKSYLQKLAAANVNDQDGLADAREKAFAFATQITFKLRTLLNTMDVAAQYYDCCVENALLGCGRFPTAAHPFHPRIPPAPAPPAGAIADANRDGSGPDDYRTYDPNLAKKAYLQGIRAAAEAGAANASPSLPIASSMLMHFLGNSGNEYRFDVNGMLRDVPEFAGRSEDTASRSASRAQSVMPNGYDGPVAFQSQWQVNPGFRADATAHPDYWAALGTFSYQTSGVYMPHLGGAGVGPGELTYQTSIYDYYNWDTTKKSPSEQYSDLNDLHRAGWAQNYEVTGTSSPHSARSGTP